MHTVTDVLVTFSETLIPEAHNLLANDVNAFCVGVLFVQTFVKLNFKYTEPS